MATLFNHGSFDQKLQQAVLLFFTKAVHEDIQNRFTAVHVIGRL